MFDKVDKVDMVGKDDKQGNWKVSEYSGLRKFSPVI